jgi:hypothetical protein
VAVLVVVVGAMVAVSASGGDGARIQGGETVHNLGAGLALRVPEGWHGSVRDGDSSGFYLWTGHVFVSEPQCEGVDETVSITILEGELHNVETVPRPAHFTRRDGTIYMWGGGEGHELASIECDEIWQRIQFTDEGRTFYALVVSGRHGSEEQRAQAYAILDTFKVGT